MSIELATADIKKKFDDLTTGIENKETERNIAIGKIKLSVERIQDYRRGVLAAIHSNVQDQEVMDLKESIRGWTQITVQNALDYSQTTFSEINEKVGAQVDRAKLRVFELNQKNQYITEERQRLKEILSKLKQGKKDYDPSVLKLVSVIDDKFGEGTAVVLADVIEVPNARWKNVIEGYLHTQKQNLLVPIHLFEETLKLYALLQEKEKIHGVGIVDTQKLSGKDSIVMPGSLAEEVVADNADARRYIDFLLGRVIKCDAVVDIRKHPIALTDEGMLYKNFVAVQMNPARWKTPYIGKQAVERQIEQTEKSILTLQETLKEHGENINALKPLTAIKAWSEHEVIQIINQLKEAERLPAILDGLDCLIKERDALDLSFLYQLEADMKLVKAECDSGKDEQKKEIEQLGIEKERCRLLLESALPKILSFLMGLKRELEEIFSETFIEELGSGRYEKERQRQSAQDIYLNFERAALGKQTEINNARMELEKLRSAYNRIYHMSHDVRQKNNEAFDFVLKELKENKLPEYLDKIKGAKEQASVQFRDEFLAKLKENFDIVKAQISELNSAIKTSSFGNDHYKFEIKPKPEHKHFYDMIMDPLLLTEGLNIMSHAFTEKHGVAIEELFNMILEVEGVGTADQRERLEKNIRYFTDYRSYLNFDLVVTDHEGREQRLSRTLLKKSGGETQTPFYIAVLASFAQMYRIAQNHPYDNTCRLIIFDEAFSKMDSQRIQESLELLKRFKLQAIVAAPPDKISDISPYVDQNLCVFRQNDHSFVKAFTKKEMMEV